MIGDGLQVFCIKMFTVKACTCYQDLSPFILKSRNKSAIKSSSRVQNPPENLVLDDGLRLGIEALEGISLHIRYCDFFVFRIAPPLNIHSVYGGETLVTEVDTTNNSQPWRIKKGSTYKHFASISSKPFIE